jgi:asparagine synthase (glutamine-hydrolysing)
VARILARFAPPGERLGDVRDDLDRARRFLGPSTATDAARLLAGAGLVAAFSSGGERVFHDPASALFVVLDGRPQKGSVPQSAGDFARSYLSLGAERAADELDGAWTAIVVDERQGRVLLFRDRVGSKPIYYRCHGGALVVGSNVGLLARAGWIPARIDANTVARYASSNYRAVFGHLDSFFEGVRRVAPASYLEWQPGQELRTRVYWDLDPAAAFFDDPAEKIGIEYRELLARTGRAWQQSWSGVKSGIALSGGIDSGTIAGIMHQTGGQRVDAVSITYAEQTDFDESRLMACSVRDHVAEWHKIELTAAAACADIPRLYERFDVPLPTVSIYGYDFLLRQAAGLGFSVLFGGSGGDALQAGTYPCYLYALADLKASGSPRYRHELQAWIAGHSTAQYPKTEATADAFFERAVDLARPGTLRGYEIPLANGILDDGFRAAAGSLDAPSVQSYGSFLRSYAMQEYFYDDVAPGAEAEDIMSWTWGASMVSPFLSREVMQFGWRLPPQLKVSDGVNKRLARMALRGICADEILDTVAKSGFNAPFDQWVRGPLREFALDIFSSRSFRERGIYRLPLFMSLVEQHLDGRANHLMLMWQALNLELWMRAWIDAAPES